MIRISGGIYKNRPLILPAGSKARPSLALMRRSLFDQLSHGLGAELSEISVLDLFAGSGALGFEALSRGGKQIAFFERDKAALAAIAGTAQKWGIGAEVHLVAGDACRPPPRPDFFAPAALVLADPPYQSELAAPALAALEAQNWLAPKAMIVLEEDKTCLSEMLPTFELVRRRLLTRAALSFWQWQG